MSVDVHRVRFYNLEPLTVNNMICDEQSGLLALSRANNSIEIWNLNHTPFIERVILGTCGTVEALAWFNKRLFSVGLQGSVIEYDLFTQSPKSFHPVTSGACWCVDVEKNRSQLAAGTEDGYINIFDIVEDDLTYNRILDRQEGRILCLTWCCNGEFIVTGSIDAVRVWNVESGHAVHRMSTGRAANKRETIVWCLAVTDDFTIISGDSRGKLCFWNGHLGTSITSYQSHKSDILAICLDKEQEVVYCSGRDPLIATYERVKIRAGDERKWVKSLQRIIHDHDVRALVFYGQRLFSAGVDGYLALSSYPPKLLLRYPPISQPPIASLSEERRSILFKYPQTLELWKLGVKSEESSVKLLHWQPVGGLFIKCASISSDGKWLACSTLERFRLYSVSYHDETPNLQKVQVPSPDSLACHCLCFSQDSCKLVLACVSGEVDVVSLSDGCAKIEHTFRPHKSKDLTDSIHLLAVSSNGKYVVAADLSGKIIIWSDGELYHKMPRYKSPPTAMRIHNQTDNLVVVYPDHKIVEFSLPKKEFTSFSLNLEARFPKQLLGRSFPVLNISFDPTNENIILMQDDSTVMVLNKNKVQITQTRAIYGTVNLGTSELAYGIAGWKGGKILEKRVKNIWHIHE